MKEFKRILAFLLVFVLCVSVLPVNTFAVNTIEEISTDTTEETAVDTVEEASAGMEENTADEAQSDVGETVECSEDHSEYEAPQLKTQSKTENFNTNYTLGSDQAANVVAVAAAQVGMTKSQLGYTEAWCADFVCDVGKLAGVASDVIPWNYGSRGGVQNLYNYMLNSCNATKVSSRKAGDFVFYYCNTCQSYTHVGIVVDSSYQIEGNMGSPSKVLKYNTYYNDASGHSVSTGVISRIYVRPNYANNVISISGQTSPSAMKVGSDFSVAGTITSQAKITSVTVGCYLADSTMVTGKTVAPNATSYDIANLDSSLSFTGLEPGVYRYKVLATNEGGTQTLVSKAFTVLNDEATIADGTYMIQTYADAGFAVDISGHVDDDLAYVQLGTSQRTTYQLFNITYDGDGYYRIQNYQSGKYLTVLKAGTTAGTLIVQWPENNGPNQRWQITPTGGGYNFVPENAPDLSLDILNNTLASGTSLQIYGTSHSSAQRFTLVETACLTVPELLTATSTEEGVEVQWKSVEGADGYRLYRKTPDGTWSACVVITDTENTSYIDTSAESKNEYVYTVRAYQDIRISSSANAYNTWYWSLYDSDGISVLYEKPSEKDPTITISDAVLPPDQMSNGYGGVTIGGVVSSGERLTKVIAGCYDVNDELVIGSSAEPNAYSYNLSLLSENLDFAELEPGIYRYKVIAENATLSETLTEKVFVVLYEESKWPVEEGTYMIQPYNDSTLTLDIENHSDENQAYVILNQISNTNYQIFNISETYLANYIDNEASGNRIWRGDDSGVYQYEETVTSNVAVMGAQEWRILPVGDGTYWIFNQMNDKCMDISGGTVESGAKIVLADPEMSSTQRFRLVATEPYSEVENPFVDISETDYYYDAVLWAYENGITQGKDATHFSPTGECTRAQVVTFLWRSQGEPEPETTENPFTDVNTSDYYYKAVLWAYENGITTGKTATEFQPDVVVNRSQFVTFLWRAEGEPAVSIDNPFEDVSAGQYYTEAVLWAYDNGITQGKDATHFQPFANCQRCQVVTFLYRAYN